MESRCRQSVDHTTNTRVLVKSLLRQQMLFFLNMLIFDVLGKNCFKCVHNWELFAKGEPIYLVKSKQKSEV